MPKIHASWWSVFRGLQNARDLVFTRSVSTSGLKQTAVVPGVTAVSCLIICGVKVASDTLDAPTKDCGHHRFCTFECPPPPRYYAVRGGGGDRRLGGVHTWIGPLCVFIMFRLKHHLSVLQFIWHTSNTVGSSPRV